MLNNILNTYQVSNSVLGSGKLEMIMIQSQWLRSFGCKIVFENSDSLEIVFSSKSKVTESFLSSKETFLPIAVKFSLFCSDKH